MCVCVCVCAQRKRQREWEREIDFKELAHTIIEANEAKTCRVGQQAGDPKKSQCCSSILKAVCWQNSFLLGRGIFLLFRPSTIWMSLTHIMQNKLFFSKVCRFK